jgi:hypothetical protein
MIRTIQASGVYDIVVRTYSCQIGLIWHDVGLASGSSVRAMRNAHTRTHIGPQNFLCVLFLFVVGIFLS